MIYIFIAFISSLLGAISGVGGGVIIKPMLDLVSNFDASTIGVLSAFTVLAMSIAALARHLYFKTEIEFRLGAILASGAFIGGYIGNNLFAVLLRWGNSDAVMLLQNLLLSALLVVVMLYMNVLRGKKTIILRNPVAVAATGLCLGTISSFIGIGGGPINMLVLTSLFSMSTKKAAVNSLLLILFSQASKLLAASITTGFAGFNLTALWVMIPSAILGGLIGAKLNKEISSKKIMFIFSLTNITVICIGIFNSARIIGRLF